MSSTAIAQASSGEHLSRSQWETHFENPTLQAWHHTQLLWKDILQHGSFRAHIQQVKALFPGQYAAAYINNGVIVCVDERVGDQYAGNINSAGSLILLTEEEQREFIRTSNAWGITWHTGCGAAALAYRLSKGLDASDPVDPEEVDRFAEAKARELAAKYNLVFLGKIGPGSPDWHGDAKTHYTNTLYWLASGAAFSPHACPGLPIGFTLTRSCLPAERALEIGQVLINIAFGSNGFGDLLTPHDPFHVIVIAESKEGALKEVAYLQEHLKDPRIVVDWFIA